MNRLKTQMQQHKDYTDIRTDIQHGPERLYFHYKDIPARIQRESAKTYYLIIDTSQNFRFAHTLGWPFDLSTITGWMENAHRMKQLRGV